MLVLEDAGAVAGKAARALRVDLWRVLASLALSHGDTQLDPLTDALRDVLAKHEHAAPLLAELCECATMDFGGGDSRLFTSLAASLCTLDANAGESSMAASSSADAASCKNAALFLQECADRMPKLVASNLSMVLTRSPVAPNPVTPQPRNP